MNVKQLYETALAAVSNHAITLSGDKGGIFSAVSDALTVVFHAINDSVSSFQVSMAVLEYDAHANVFSISTQDICEIYSGYCFECISFSSSALTLVCRTGGRALDEEEKLMLFDCTKSFSSEYGAPDVSDETRGRLQIGEAKMSVKGSRNAGGVYEYRLEENGNLPAGALLSGFFGMYSIPMFLREEDIPLQFSHIEAVFTENSNGEKMVHNDSFAVKAGIDCSLKVGGVFAIDSLTFYFEKFGCEYSLALGGSMRMLKMPSLKFMAGYDGGSYLFGVSGEGNQDFGFGQIAELTGVDAEKVFPEKAARAQGLKLEELTVRTDFKEVQSFRIGILWDERWVICERPELALADIRLWINIAGEQRAYGIEGVITLFGKDVCITAEYETEAGWIFRGSLSAYTPLRLQEAAENAAQLFGIPDFTLPMDVDVVGFSVAVGLAGEFELSGMILAGGSKDSTLAKIFNGKCRIHIRKERAGKDLENTAGKEYGNETEAENAAGLTAEIDGTINLCGNQFELNYESRDKNRLTAAFAAGSREKLSFKALLRLFGDEALSDALPDCFNLSLEELSLSYEFGQDEKELHLQTKLSVFDLEAVFRFGEETDYSVTIFIHGSIDLSGIPVAGAVLKNLGEDTSISGFTLTFSKKEGFVFDCCVCGQDFKCVLVSPAARLEAREWKTDSEKTDSGFLKWMTVNIDIGAFHLNRMGISLKGSRLGILVDVSLLVNPFTFELLGAGIETDVPSLHSPKFLLEGFGVDFRSDSLSVSGAFRHNGDSYMGEIKVAAGSFSIVVMGEYSGNGMTAYAVLSYPLGGPPCFVVTGLAAAFGYNRKLRLPEIENVADYPLVAAAAGEYDQAKLINGLKEYVTDCSGERFLAAGVKFTSFEIVKGFALLTAAFGRTTEIGLLGLADIVMPPNNSKTPIARAQLVLKAAVQPAAGLISCEARLSDASYIFSEKCRLQGGFAAYIWFSGCHKGDFVITLGGYHPACHKPGHYPDVPRLGFNWDVLPEHNRLVLSGEVYFALTPSAIMAGGKLSAVYSYGSLRAYFIAYADFLLQWKPFAYDIRLGIMLGASYRVDKWFIHHTFTIELAADLHIWGPEFSGEAHISWFIISFTIPFGNTKKESVPPLNWEEFRDSFLPAADEKREGACDTGGRNPLSVKLAGETADGVVRADDFGASVYTMIPIKRANLSGQRKEEYKKEIPIQPMNGTLADSLVTVKLIEGMGTEREKEWKDRVEYSFLYGNVPSALWGKKDSEKELVEDVPVGISMYLQEYKPEWFPDKGEISGELLKEAGKLEVKDAFETVQTPACRTYEHRDTIDTFQKTAGNISTAGMALLRSMGFTGNASLNRYARNADNLFDDDILIVSDY